MNEDDELKKLLDKKFRSYLRGDDRTRRDENPYRDRIINLDTNLFRELLFHKYPLFVDFWAAWCAPCRAMEPIIHGLMEKYSYKMIFGKLNVDHYPEIASKYMVMSIPTFIIFRDGKPLDRLIGAQPKRRIEEMILRHID